jgi:hypothetical protein
MLGGPPLLASALMVVAMAPRNPAIWLLAAFITSLAAYASLFIGVLPTLMLFKRFGWQGPFHFVAAGFLGVFLLWMFPALALISFRGDLGAPSPGDYASAVKLLMLPSSLSSDAAFVFWFVCRRYGRLPALS